MLPMTNGQEGIPADFPKTSVSSLPGALPEARAALRGRLAGHRGDEVPAPGLTVLRLHLDGGFSLHSLAKKHLSAHFKLPSLLINAYYVNYLLGTYVRV